MKVFYADTALLPDPARESGFYRELPAPRLEKALRLLSPQKRRESAGAGLLLCRILPRFSARAEEVFLDGRGKPSHPRLFLSLAHGGGLAVLAVGESPLGCDVEKIAGVREGVLGRFTREERSLVAAAAARGEGVRARAFYALWTGKESYCKMTGEGLSIWRDVCVSAEGRVLRAGAEQPCRIVWKEAGEHILAACSMEGEASFEEIRL